MGLPIIAGTTWATWNGIIYPPYAPNIPFNSPVLRGTGSTQLPQRSPPSPVITETFIGTRAEADRLIQLCYSISGFNISATDDEGVAFTNLFVDSVICTKPIRKQGETVTGTAGLVYHVKAAWVFIAALPENT